MSELYINIKGELIESVDFGNNDIVDYTYNSISEHEIFGIYFSYSDNDNKY